MIYRVSLFQYLEVPKALAHETVDGREEEAVTRAKEVLLQSDADVVVVAALDAGETRVIHRFEKAKKAS